MSELVFKVELGASYIPNQRWAHVMLNDSTVFTDCVYDTEENPAALNIQRLFADRLRRLLEGD